MLTVVTAVPPAAMVDEPGDAAMEKSLLTVPPPSAAWSAPASTALPLMSSAGSLLCQERTSSTYSPPWPVKVVNESFSHFDHAGHQAAEVAAVSCWRVRAVDHRAGVDRAGALGVAEDVGDLRAHAVGEGGALADHEAGAPGVVAEQPVPLLVGEGRVLGVAAGLLVERLGGDEAEGVRVDVEVGVVTALVEDVRARHGRRGGHLGLEVGDQLGGGDREAGRGAGVGDRGDQVGVGQGADVVQVQRVLAGVVGDVVRGPGRGLGQVRG